MPTITCPNLAKVGYHASPDVRQAVAGLLAQEGIMRAGLVTGPPGCGKTALAEALAQATGAQFLYYLCHAWSSSDELFAGVHVPSAVAGKAETVEQAGVLLQAARGSQNGRVILCVDELDKAPEAVESLLLDFLQSGRVPVAPGVHEMTRMEHVIVLITSNGTRPHSDALLRRCRRIRMQHPSPDVRRAIVAQRTGAPLAACALLDELCDTIATAESSGGVSLQEQVACMQELLRAAHNLAAVSRAVEAWCVRTEEGLAAARTKEAARKLNGIHALLEEYRQEKKEARDA